MTNAGPGMPCPVCKVLLVMSDRQGVEIDYCPQCRSAAASGSIAANSTRLSSAAAGPTWRRKRCKSVLEELFD